MLETRNLYCINLQSSFNYQKQNLIYTCRQHNKYSILLWLKMSQPMRLWYLSHRRPAMAQVSLRIRAVSPEPSLFAHMNYGSRRKVRPKIRHLAPLDGCACVFKEWIYRGQKVLKSHELDQIIFLDQRAVHWRAQGPHKHPWHVCASIQTNIWWEHPIPVNYF